MSAEPSWAEKIVAIHERLEQAGLPYAFGGAIALNYYREPRATLDVDINVFLPPEQQADVLAVLSGLYDLPDRDRIERQLIRDGQSRTTWKSTYVDLFLSTTELHDSMAARIQRQPFGDTEIPVLSVEDLLVCKVLFDRPKDWVDVSAVAAAEGSQLDRQYIYSWLQHFVGPDDERIPRITEELERPGQSP